ncbi:DNA polymerase I [Lactiplantibacillus fabifermentans]|uniref:DNA polymerase I n=2 Tax=Lactiplantibacillus fabifermentans TaxID=483011 RepID=A0A0R2NSK9_9LACO|nr:DNA polymerase I [Lactiplantibacillus fabifermentans]ETY74451.1 DNA polymerase I [Lactiplantibacillus fabifermentans T30PCM01]KRO28660.1 dna polymerase i [Lactiplantibacillus fabifermentans DSM 21115]
MAKKLLLIDGNSVAFRAFFALHNQLDRFVNADGLHTNAIYGFNTMLDHMIKAVEPTDMLVAFDAGKTTFRTAMFDNYKGGRAKTPGEFSEQMPYIEKLLDAYGIQHYKLKDYEADDIIGTLAGQADAAGYTTTIVTGDRDLTQLTTNHTTVAVTVKGVSEVERYTPEHVQEKLGITPAQIIDMKGLTGDTSDNYPGVTKVGEKTALKLLKEYGSIEGVYENIDGMKKSKMKEHLIEDHDLATRAKVLATIKRDAPIAVGLADLAYEGPNIETLAEFYTEMDFQSFLKKLNVQSAEPAAPIEYTVLTKENLGDLAQFKDHVDFYLEMPTPNYHTSAFAGFALGFDGHWYISRDVELLMTPAVADILASSTIQKDVFDMKRTIVGLHRLGLTLKAVDFDLLLVSYLLDTNDNSNDLGNLAEQHGYTELPTDETVYGKGVKRAIPDDDDIFFSHLARKLAAMAALKPELLKKLDENEQTPLYHDIEKPMALVLAQMEMAGIKVDADTLKAMGSQFKERLAEIEQTIYNEAGEEFNINSPKQLGHILFEQMKLPVIKKTKTGYSTAVDVLEKLAPEAPIVDNILKYRQISKIQSTYVEGLLDAIHSSDQKVHTRYLQTLTQTGRLSSVDPNLQNIPVRLEEGRKIRQAFVPSHDGWQIFSSDYSQIELRVLAHITHDENMQAAFKEGDDIHAATAMRIFNLDSPDKVTPNIRRQAKAVNFGIVYGISDYGLSQNIGITRKQAKAFIDSYFREYPGVKAYMDEIVKKAHDQGYVETIAHRRRYLPDINAKSFNARSFAERTAMNTPIQGSAADIIKIAMINMQAKLKEAGLQATMLLQVHDELIFEAPADEIPVLEKLVPSVMDSAVQLEVPLKVESHFGNTWYDAK